MTLRFNPHSSEFNRDSKHPELRRPVCIRESRPAAAAPRPAACVVPRCARALVTTLDSGSFNVNAQDGRRDSDRDTSSSTVQLELEY